MSPSRAARTAVVCTLLVGIAIARAQPAERRPVAVIDLSDSPEGEKLAKDLGGALNTHADLRPIDDAQSQAAMIGKIEDEDADRIDTEQKNKQQAEDAIRRGEFPRAASIAEAAMLNLASFGAPAPAVIKLYGELAFILGTARLGNRNPQGAAEAFRLSRSLLPQFRPDPALTYPEVIEAFDKALAQPVVTGTLAVNGQGRIHLDDRNTSKDASTWLTEVPAGLHVVWLVGPERDARGKQVRVVAGQKEEVSIDAAPTSAPRLVARARVTLKQASPPFASDPAARAAAILHLAKKVHARDAILVTSVNKQLVIQTWRDRAPGFSAHREVKGDSSAKLLEMLAPPKRIVVKPEKGPEVKVPKIPVVEKHWYEKPRYVIGGPAVTIALVVLGVVAFQSLSPETVDVKPPGFRQ